MRRVLVAALAVLLTVGCAQDRPGGGRSGSLLPRDRLELPELTPDAFRAMLAELRGTPGVVNIWGSWCPPCIVEAPDLAQVSAEFQGRVQFVGVDILDQRQAAREFIRRFDWQYPSVFDPTGAIRDGLGYVGQPVTLIYDRDGTLAFEWNGVTTADLLRREIREVL
jgi:cytochrome c biogenesis protein CcmG/thiol:disulfide interchange protein DsbE